MSLLTEGDKQILPIATRERGGYHVASKWFCMGWEPLWYQYLFHQAPVPGGKIGETVPNSTFLAGIAAGKTTSVASSYLVDCLTIPYFRALNTSVTAKQAELPFETVQGWINDNPKLDHLVEGISLRPYTTVKFKNGSEWVFRTAGKDARFIRGMEFDRLNYDEAGLDYIGETLKVLRGRLRGNRTDGTARMVRMDVTTSPTSAPWLEERFEKGWKGSGKEDLENYLSLRISTYMNTKLTKQSIALMVAEYSDDMIDVELNAEFPNYGVSMFSRQHVQACTDQSLYDAAYIALNPDDGSKPKAGYVIDEHPRYGVVRFEVPPIPGHLYVMAGDPGLDAPPRRNAAVVGVLDVSVNPRQLVYFHWIDGMGSYNPFLGSYKYAMKKYHPLLKGMDTTGTQKAIDELAFENMGLEIDGINFQKDKEAMVNSLNSIISNHEMKFPPIRGLLRQMLSYNRENEKKLAQDIVMVMALLAFLERHIMDYDEKDQGDQTRNIPTGVFSYNRHTRRTTSNRRRR